jgi:hypothetical protein
MITGRGDAAPGEAALIPAPLWRFLLSVVLAAGLTVILVRFL